MAFCRFSNERNGVLMAQTRICRGVCTRVNRKAYLENNEPLTVIYRGTRVLYWNSEKKFGVLSTGGWKTVTTRARIMQAVHEFNLPFKLSQKRYTWGISLPGYPRPWCWGEPGEDDAWITWFEEKGVWVVSFIPRECRHPNPDFAI